MVEQKWDVYNCDECGQAFAVQKDEEPNACSFCKSESWEYSHTMTEVIEK